MPWPLLTELSPNINDINEKFMVIICKKNFASLRRIKRLNSFVQGKPYGFVLDFLELGVGHLLLNDGAGVARRGGFLDDGAA